MKDGPMTKPTKREVDWETWLDSAMRNLNKTYGGLAGELGETVPELRGLTAEQMKNGAAVKILGERYKGLASLRARLASKPSRSETPELDDEGKAER